MGKRYAIWNKKDNIITPIMENLTSAQWIERYPAAGNPNITVVCSAGIVNGGFFGVLETMVMRYESEGCDFSACNTDEEKLSAIESFLDAREAEEKVSAENSAASADVTADSLASIAASLEFQNMMALPDVEV
jgi:hypothetical protein